MRIIDFLQQHMLTCPSKKLLHMDCPGCGMQRSILCLLSGDIKGSLNFHPATIPMIGLFLFLVLHLIFRFRYGGKIIITLYLLVVIITSVFYIYKIINHKIFT